MNTNIKNLKIILNDFEKVFLLDINSFLKTQGVKEIVIKK
jgi:hypothetical protein